MPIISTLTTEKLDRILDAVFAKHFPDKKTLHEIATNEARCYNIPIERLRGPRKTTDLVKARRWAYIEATECGFTQVQIGAYFGGRHHTTIGHSLKKMV